MLTFSITISSLELLERDYDVERVTALAGAKLLQLEEQIEAHLPDAVTQTREKLIERFGSVAVAKQIAEQSGKIEQ